MLELARDLAGGRTRRTIVLASTSGGSGGAAGVREVLRSIEGPIAAVLVLGDLAGRRQTPPYVVGWSADGGQSALGLRRTVQAALARETGRRVRSEDVLTQWARLAAPFAVGEQGPVAAAGVPAALVSLTGESTPPAGDPLDDRRFQAMGRGVLRAVTALDAAPSPPAGADRDLEVLRKAVPEWAVRVLVGALLLAPALVAVDALARARRRRRAVAPWLGWILATGAVVLVTLLFARGLGLVGLLGPATAPPAPPGAVALDRTGWAGLAAVGLAFALLVLALRPLLLRLAGAAGRVPDDGAGVAMVAGLVTVALAMWVVNPYAALLLVPAAHLWLLVASPEAPLPRPARLALVAAGLAPAVWLVVTLAGVLGVGPGGGAWWALLALAGGQGAVLGWLLSSLGAGCAGLAVVLALRRRPAPPPATVRRPVREPLAYAGPRPRDATESALHR